MEEKTGCIGAIEKNQIIFANDMAYLIYPFGESLFLDGITLIGDFKDSAISGIELQNGNGFPLDPSIFT